MTDSDEDLDNSVNDPDFEMADSDVQSSDEFDDNDQAQGHDNDYVSDSSDQSDVIPCVKSLPALQINKVTSSKSEIKNKAGTSTSLSMLAKSVNHNLQHSINCTSTRLTYSLISTIILCSHYLGMYSLYMCSVNQTTK